MKNSQNAPVGHKVGVIMECCQKKIKEANQKVKRICPTCNNLGVNVKMITLQSLLKESPKKLINDSLKYSFCKNKNCEVVYFTSIKTHLFLTTDLIVKVTSKDEGIDVPTCYCFNYTRKSILEDLKLNGKTTAIDDIKAKMKNPGCFCEKSNPQGSCCLSNNLQWIEKAKKQLGI